MPAMPARKGEESCASHASQKRRGPAMPAIKVEEIYDNHESMRPMRLTLPLPPPWQLRGMALGHC